MVAELGKPQLLGYDAVNNHPDKAVTFTRWEAPPKRVVTPAEYLRYFTFTGWKYKQALPKKDRDKATEGMPMDAFSWVQEKDFGKDREFFVWRDTTRGVFHAEDLGPEIVIHYKDAPKRIPDLHHVRDYWRASEYWDEVDKLDRSPAGWKARELFCEFLSDVQRRDLDMHGLFYEITRKVSIEVQDDGSEIAHITSGPWLLFFCRPSMQIRSEDVSFCWHPEEPIPSYDIALAHLLEFRESPTRYKQQANW